MKADQKYIQITQEIFEKVIINESRPGVLVFGAEWSGSTEIMDNIVSRVTAKIDLDINYYKVDIESQTKISEFFGVSKVPTIVMINEGEIIDKIQGFVSASKLKNRIEIAFLSLSN